MPTYCYENRDGDVIERVYPVSRAPKGVKVGSDWYRRIVEPINVPSSAGWPMTCYASGVHASDAQSLRDHFTKAGVPTEVTKEGDPVYKNAIHRKKALKCRGYVDKSSFN